MLWFALPAGAPSSVCFFPCLKNQETFQELSPTNNTNLAVALMKLMEAQMDGFKDPAKIKAMDQREVIAWLEVPDLYC